MDTYDILEIYVKACELVDTNTKNQVDLSKERFVLFYNSAQNNYLRSIVNALRSSDLVEIAQRFLSGVQIQQESSETDCFKYTLPEDFVKHVSILAKAIKGECDSNGYHMTLDEAKASDIQIWLTDSCRKPSFEFRESFYYVGSDGVHLYTDNTFSYSQVILLYYRLPIQVDIEGYEKEDGSQSTNIQTEWSRTEVEAILDIMVAQYSKAQLPIKQE